MRRALWLLCLVCACHDDNEVALDGSTRSDAGSDSGALSSLLPPGTLEHPPTALADDLKPPR